MSLCICGQSHSENFRNKSCTPNQQHMHAWAHKTSAQVTNLAVKNECKNCACGRWGVGYIIYEKTKPIFDDLHTLQFIGWLTVTPRQRYSPAPSNISLAGRP